VQAKEFKTKFHSLTHCSPCLILLSSVINESHFAIRFHHHGHDVNLNSDNKCDVDLSLEQQLPSHFVFLQ